jgi:hypothetical protein
MDGSVQVFVTAPEEVMQVIKVGDQTRTVGATKMNERSSRSHSLLMVAPTRIFMASWPADVPCRGYLWSTITRCTPARSWRNRAGVGADIPAAEDGGRLDENSQDELG